MRFQVRRWDSFYQEYNMIPDSMDTIDEAFDRAVERAIDTLDSGFWYMDEIQVWVDDELMDGWRMVGYIDMTLGFNEDEFRDASILTTVREGMLFGLVAVDC